MPLNVRRFFASFSLIFSGFLIAGAQTAPPANNPNNTSNTTANPIPATAAPSVPAPTSGDVMRARISKAKAFIAVRNYNAAIYELENIRRETNDSTVNGVVNVLLMNSYLEQGDYKRAQDFLGEFYKAQTANKPNAGTQYMTVAAQVVKGARNQLERYRALGLMVSDKNLPLEASVDIQKMRDTLETVIDQSRVIGKDKKQTPTAMALLEEAATTRANLAKDDYDARRWKDAIGDVREEMVNSNSIIVNAAGDLPPDARAVSTNTMAAAVIPTAIPPKVTQPAAEPAKPNDSSALFKPVVIENRSNPSAGAPAQIIEAKETPPPASQPNVETAKPNDDKNAEQNAATRTRTVENSPANMADGNASKDVSPLQVGSLITYATKKSNPNYPTAAKSMRATGVVTVEIMVDESGEVSEIQKTDGPAILQGAAKDAIKKWKFKPFVRDGQPIRATGFVSFNFAL